MTSFGLAFMTEDGIRFPYALAEGNDGGYLQRVDIETESVETVFTHCDDTRIGNLNDIVFDTTGAHHWDGLAVDGAGNICASNLQHSGVTVISPTGAALARFVTPLLDTFVTNICFGGPTGNRAYICSSGRGILYSIEWPWPGLRLNFAR